MEVSEMYMEWTDAGQIAQWPEYHSTPMRIKRLLVCLNEYEDPVIGWYFSSGQRWQIAGSHSDWNPTYFMPMPKKPGVM